MSRPATSCSRRYADSVSTYCSRKREITIASRNDLVPRFSVYQLGRGKDPVMVVGKTFPAVAFSMIAFVLLNCVRYAQNSAVCGAEAVSLSVRLRQGYGATRSAFAKAPARQGSLRQGYRGAGDGTIVASNDREMAPQPFGSTMVALACMVSACVESSPASTERAAVD